MQQIDRIAPAVRRTHPVRMAPPQFASCHRHRHRQQHQHQQQPQYHSSFSRQTGLGQRSSLCREHRTLPQILWVSAAADRKLSRRRLIITRQAGRQAQRVTQQTCVSRKYLVADRRHGCVQCIVSPTIQCIYTVSVREIFRKCHPTSHHHPLMNTDLLLHVCRERGLVMCSPWPKAHNSTAAAAVRSHRQRRTCLCLQYNS